MRYCIKSETLHSSTLPLPIPRNYAGPFNILAMYHDLSRCSAGFDSEASGVANHQPLCHVSRLAQVV